MIRSVFLPALFILIFSATASAKNRIGVSFLSGKDYRQGQLSGLIDLKESKSIDLALSRSKTIGDSTGQTISASGGYSFEDGEENSYRLGANYWKDSTNRIRYIGPTVDYTRTYFDHAEDEEKKTENFAFSILADLNFYSADLYTDGSNRPLTRRSGLNGSNKTEVTRVTQFHPKVEFEKSFYNESLKPFIGYGVYLYSKSPESIEDSTATSTQRYRTINTWGISTMTAGFARQSYDIGTRIKASSTTYGTFSFARTQLYIDKSWANAFTANLNQYLVENFRIKLGWTLTVQSGEKFNTFNLGFDYLF